MADNVEDPRRIPGWKRDPWRRYAGRYWDGEEWTEHVISDDRSTAVDPVPMTPPPSSAPPPPPPAPPAAATSRQSAPAASPPPTTSRSRTGPGWRKLTWVILAFNVLMAVWLIGGTVSVADDSDCEEEHPVVEIDPGAPASERLAQAQENLRNLDLREACEAGTAVGAGLGAAFIVFLWVAGDVILGVIWLVTRRSRTPERACPVCGSAVPVGQVVCSGCGYDYRTKEQGPIPDKPPIWPPPGVTGPPRKLGRSKAPPRGG